MQARDCCVKKGHCKLPFTFFDTLRAFLLHNLRVHMRFQCIYLHFRCCNVKKCSMLYFLESHMKALQWAHWNTVIFMHMHLYCAYQNVPACIRCK